ncbi:MAG TPA: hypothetical protein VLC95_13170, partial [Anaerolineae bacterium]|nr:hypothetical protein [Anaerolineae bacterium]
MTQYLFAATEHGLLFLEKEGERWREAGGTLHNHHFTTIDAAGQAVLAGAKDGIHRSDDAGQTWWESSEGLTERHVRWIMFHPEDARRAYAGTEPAAIFRSDDGGRTWRLCPEVVRLRDEGGWNLPYSPEAGAIRGFAFNGARGYAAAEQGGLLRSDNWGESWQMAAGSTGQVSYRFPPGFIHPDVHSVVVHPTTPDQVFAPTGGGFYYSYDGGRSWEQIHDHYGRAVWVDPERPAHMILGAADSAHSNGRIVRTIEGGDTWELEMRG